MVESWEGFGTLELGEDGDAEEKGERKESWEKAEEAPQGWSLSGGAEWASVLPQPAGEGLREFWGLESKEVRGQSMGRVGSERNRTRQTM